MHNNKLYIGNGVDPLSIYDGSSVIRYNPLNPPTGLTATLGSGLTPGTYIYSYRVTALNNVGETQGSVAVTITTNIRREEWNFDPNNPNIARSILLTWNAVPGAVKYNVYGVLTGQETFLDQVNGTTYRDYGLKEPSLFFSVPTSNTTQAPKGNILTTYKSSIIIAGDPVAPSRLYYSAGLDKPEDFSIGSGGGWIDLKQGAEDGVITAVYPFRDNLIVFKNKSVWSFRFGQDTPTVINISNLVGAVNQYSVSQVENDLFFVNEVGNGIALYSLGNEPTFQDVLRTNEVSVRVKNSLISVPRSSLNKVNLCYSGKKVYLGYTSGSSDVNNACLVYNRERAVYSEYTNLSIEQIQEVLDNTGSKKLLWIDSRDNTIVEYQENLETDKGENIHWKLKTKVFEASLPLGVKRLMWVSFDSLSATGVVVVNLYLDNRKYTTTINATPPLIQTVLGVVRLGIARLGIANNISIQYNNKTYIPIHRVGYDSICNRFSLELESQKAEGIYILQNLEFVYKLMQHKTETFDHIVQL
jgi:hypothetical protein